MTRTRLFLLAALLLGVGTMLALMPTIRHDNEAIPRLPMCTSVAHTSTGEPATFCRN